MKYVGLRWWMRRIAIKFWAHIRKFSGGLKIQSVQRNLILRKYTESSSKSKQSYKIRWCWELIPWPGLAQKLHCTRRCENFCNCMFGICNAILSLSGSVILRWKANIESQAKKLYLKTSYCLERCLSLNKFYKIGIALNCCILFKIIWEKMCLHCTTAAARVVILKLRLTIRVAKF